MRFDQGGVGHTTRYLLSDRSMSDAAATEADVLRCGYDVGYFDKSDIIAWADRQIAASDAPRRVVTD